MKGHIMVRGSLLIRGSLATLGLAVGASVATAAPVSYGNFNGSTVVFEDIVGDSVTDPAPLYGAPAVIGDQLDFSPTAFGSSATGGAADITDGLLMGEVQAKPGYFLDSFSFSEFGDYTLVGVAGTPITSANIGQIFFIKVVEVDGVALGSNAFTLVGNSVFTSAGDFFLPGEAGIAQAWSGSGSVDIAAGLALEKLSNPTITGDFVTGIEFSSNNTLVTTSEVGTAAFIQKKDVVLDIASGVVPEPASLTLIGVGITGLLLRRRRI